MTRTRRAIGRGGCDRNRASRPSRFLGGALAHTPRVTEDGKRRQGVAIVLPDHVGWTGGRADHLRRRRSRRRGHLDGVAGLLPARPGRGRHPRAGPRRRRGAGVPPQPPRARPALRQAPHRRDGGLRHHQPALLRADPGRRAAGPGLGVHAGAGQRRGVTARRVGPDPAAGRRRRRVRAGREPAARREPGADLCPAPPRPHEPRAARPGQCGARPRRGVSADRRDTWPRSATASSSTWPVLPTPGWRAPGGPP